MSNTGSVFKKNEQKKFDLLKSYQSDLSNKQNYEKNWNGAWRKELKEAE